MNGGLEIDGAIVDCRPALISAAQGCCVRELASSSALKSPSLSRRDETKPGNRRASLYSCPPRPSPAALSQSLCSLLLFYLLSLIFLFCSAVESSHRACPCRPFRQRAASRKLSGGRREKVAVGCSAGPAGVEGVRGESAAGREEGAPLVSDLTRQQRDHYGLLIQLRSEEILVSG